MPCFPAPRGFTWQVYRWAMEGPMALLKGRVGKRSPIRQTPLPQAGEGLRALIHDRVMDAASWALMGLASVLLAALEWYRYALSIPPMPKVYSFIAVVTCAYCYVRARRAGRDLPSLRL